MINFWLIITFLGSFKWLFPATVLTVICLAVKRRKKEAISLALTMAAAPLISDGLKNIIREPRPNVSALVTETSYSFPSGHALNSAVFYLLLIYLFKIKNKYAAWLLILLIGISRIYLGVHYYWDIIGGWIIGYGIYKISLKLFR